MAISNKPWHKATPGNFKGGAFEEATQPLIATIETSLTASRAYAVGERFIYQGLLYRVTSAISQGSTITINGNCVLSNTVQAQIKSLVDTASVLSSAWTAMGAKFGNQGDIVVSSEFRDIIVAIYPRNNQSAILFPINKAVITSFPLNYFFASAGYLTYTAQIHAHTNNDNSITVHFQAISDSGTDILSTSTMYVFAKR